MITLVTALPALAEAAGDLPQVAGAAEGHRAQAQRGNPTRVSASCRYFIEVV
jgi:hypothetical protein